jgi:hypothetical protein
MALRALPEQLTEGVVGVVEYLDHSQLAASPQTG